MCRAGHALCSRCAACIASPELGPARRSSVRDGVGRTPGLAGHPARLGVARTRTRGGLAARLRSPRLLFVLLAGVLLVVLSVVLTRDDPPVVKVSSAWPYDIPLSCTERETLRAQLQAVSDLTGDGRPEFFVVASCQGSASLVREVLYAYHGTGGRSSPKLLGVLLDQDDGPDGRGLHKIRVVTNRRQVTVNSEDLGGFRYMTDVFRWTGSAFERTKGNTGTIGD